MLELVITLTICHMSSSTHLGLTNVFHQTVTTKPLDNFWHSTGFTPPSSEPEESAEFLLSRGQRGVLTGSDFRNGIAKELKIPLRIRIQGWNLYSCTGWPISWRTWVVLTLTWDVPLPPSFLPSCSTTSAKFPSAQAEPVREWNSQNQSQPNPGSPGNGQPYIGVTNPLLLNPNLDLESHKAFSVHSLVDLNCC